MLNECRLCGSDDLTLWMRDGHNSDLDYYRCGHCALWNYDLDCGMDQSQYMETYVSPRDPGHRFNHQIKTSWNYLRPYVSGPGSIMDIGCGNAALLYFAREEGWDVRGMELSASTAEAIRDDLDIDVVVANFLDYEREANEAYDVVVLRHVLEHLPDSKLAMQKIGELLKKSGTAFLEFPNTGSVSYKLKRILKNRGMKNKKYAEDWRPGHCNEFCREAFEYLLRETGFELVNWRTYSNKEFANYFYRFVPIASKVRVVARKK